MTNGLRCSVVLALAALSGCASHSARPRDMANPDANRAPYDSQGGVRSIRCESSHGRTRHCDMDTRGGVFLSRRLSSTPCIQGRNWDVDQDGVWVAKGCRAEFSTGGGSASGGDGGDGVAVRCESEAGGWRHCDAPVVRGVRLRRNVSRTPCIQGDNWGWDARGVWVNHGCRGDFQVF